ncbi:17002_t:CDS:1, partial [Gigaspora rosea]
AFLKHEVDRYQSKRKFRYNPIQGSTSPNPLEPPLACSVINSEEEVNARIKEATDNL